MNLELSDIVFLLVIFLLAYGWWRNSNIKERAIAAARAHCQKLNLQFLDESVARHSWKPAWENSQPCVKRSYLFEFTSTGRMRYQGQITYVGNQLSNIWLSPHDV